jgi:hypothetical protein
MVTVARLTVLLTAVSLLLTITLLLLLRGWVGRVAAVWIIDLIVMALGRGIVALLLVLVMGRSLVRALVLSQWVLKISMRRCARSNSHVPEVGIDYVTGHIAHEAAVLALDSPGYCRRSLAGWVARYRNRGSAGRGRRSSRCLT